MAQHYEVGPFGGAGGKAFKSQVVGGADVRKIIIGAGDLIDSLQFITRDKLGVHHTLDKIGGAGGCIHEWTVPEGQFIIQIDITASTYL
jgi:hypothetical protein